MCVLIELLRIWYFLEACLINAFIFELNCGVEGGDVTSDYTSFLVSSHLRDRLGECSPIIETRGNHVHKTRTLESQYL